MDTKWALEYLSIRTNGFVEGTTGTSTYVFCISKRTFIWGCIALGPLKPGLVGDLRGNRADGVLSSERGEMRMSNRLGSGNENGAVLKKQL